MKSIMIKVVTFATVLALTLCLMVTTLAAAPQNAQSFITNLPEQGFRKTNCPNAGYAVTIKKDATIIAFGYPSVSLVAEEGQYVAIYELPDAASAEPGNQIAESSLTLVAKATITVDSEYDNKTGMNWVALSSPVTLNAGKSYVIDGSLYGVDGNLKYDVADYFNSFDTDYAATVNDDIGTVIGIYYGWDGQLNFRNFSANHMYMGVTFYINTDTPTGGSGSGGNGGSGGSAKTGDTVLPFLAVIALFGAAASVVVLRKKARV